MEECMARVTARVRAAHTRDGARTRAREVACVREAVCTRGSVCERGGEGAMSPMRDGAGVMMMAHV